MRLRILTIWLAKWAAVAHDRLSFIFTFWPATFLQQGGIGDRKLCDYVASLLEAFSRANRLQVSGKIDHRAQQYISDMLIALTRANPEQPRVIHLPVTG